MIFFLLYCKSCNIAGSIFVNKISFKFLSTNFCSSYPLFKIFLYLLFLFLYFLISSLGFAFFIMAATGPPAYKKKVQSCYGLFYYFFKTLLLLFNLQSLFVKKRLGKQKLNFSSSIKSIKMFHLLKLCQYGTVLCNKKIMKQLESFQLFLNQ